MVIRLTAKKIESVVRMVTGDEVLPLVKKLGGKADLNKISQNAFQCITFITDATRNSCKFTNEIRATNEALDPLGKQIGRIRGGMKRLSAAFKVVAAYGIAGTLTYGLINSLRRGVSEIFEFDQALYNLQAITDATGAEIRVMGETMKDVASRTKFSAMRSVRP